MTRLFKLVRDDRGLALAEYGLVAAIVGATIAVASLALGTAVSSEMAAPTTCQSGAAAC